MVAGALVVTLGIVPGPAAHAHVCGVAPRIPARTPVRFELPITTELETARSYALALPDGFTARAADADPYPTVLNGRRVVITDVPPMACATVVISGEFTKPGRYVLPVTITLPSGRTVEYTDPHDLLAPAPEVVVTRSGTPSPARRSLLIPVGLAAAGITAVGWVLLGGRRRRPVDTHRPHRARR